MQRIVPWADRDEWLQTYKNLYNFDNVKQQIKGIKRVEAWKSRSGNKLPLSIEVTTSLIAAGIEDIQSQASPYVVQHVMAMALVRFVNSMVDLEQKGAYARSVQSIADQIGLPDWLVDLRHEATHASLPSFEVLRAGCRFSLDWLRDCYWESQIAEFNERDKTLVALLVKYVTLCENNKAPEKKNKKAKHKEIAKEIADLVDKYNMWETLMDISFGEEGLLIPSLEILQELFPDFGSLRTTEISLEIPKEFRRSLIPLLKALQNANERFLCNFVSFLLKRVNVVERWSNNDPLAYYVSSWIFFILLNRSNKNSEQKQWKIKAQLDYFALLELCLNNPSTYTQHILPLIIDNLEITSDNLRDRLHTFSTINVAFSEEKESAKKHNETGVLERLEKEFPLVAEQAKNKRAQFEEEATSSWQKCPRSFAHNIKFGSFLGNEELQIEDMNETDDELMQVETNYEYDSSRERSGHDSMDSESEDNIGYCSGSSDSYDTNDEETRYSGDASDALTMVKFTDNTIQDIKKNIWIF